MSSWSVAIGSIKIQPRPHLYATGAFYRVVMPGEASPEHSRRNRASPSRAFISRTDAAAFQHLRLRQNAPRLRFCSRSQRIPKVATLQTYDPWITKIMASGPITSWEVDGETVETVSDFIFLSPKSLQMVTATMKLKDTPWKESYDQSR